MVTWQELNNEEGLGENIRKTIDKDYGKFEQQAIINENIINNLYRTLSHCTV